MADTRASPAFTIIAVRLLGVVGGRTENSDAAHGSRTQVTVRARCGFRAVSKFVRSKFIMNPFDHGLWLIVLVQLFDDICKCVIIIPGFGIFPSVAHSSKSGEF